MKTRAEFYDLYEGARRVMVSGSSRVVREQCSNSSRVRYIHFRANNLSTPTFYRVNGIAEWIP